MHCVGGARTGTARDGHFIVDLWTLCLPVGALPPGPAIHLCSSEQPASCTQYVLLQGKSVCVQVCNKATMGPHWCCGALREICHFFRPWFSHLNNGCVYYCLKQLPGFSSWLPTWHAVSQGFCDICPLPPSGAEDFLRLLYSLLQGRREGNGEDTG